MEIHKDITDRTLLTIASEDCGSNVDERTHVLGKSAVSDVYSMTLVIRVCLFQKVSLQNRSYLFKKKSIVVKSRKKNAFCNYFFST